MTDTDEVNSSLVEDLMSREIDILTFPSHFNIAIQIKTTVADDHVRIEDVAEIIKRDPLISVKVLQEASRRSRDGYKHTNLAKAINVLGFDHLKRIVLMMAMRQLQLSKTTIKHAALSRLIWLNGSYVACASHVICDNLTTRIDPEEAFMSGLMLNMGAFYLLHQASINACLNTSFDSVIAGIDAHYLARTLDILTMFEMSPVCRVAVSIDKITGDEWIEDPTSLRMVVKMANKMATIRYPWITRSVIDDTPEMYKVLRPEIDAMFETLKRNNY